MVTMSASTTIQLAMMMFVSHAANAGGSVAVPVINAKWSLCPSLFNST